MDAAAAQVRPGAWQRMRRPGLLAATSVSFCASPGFAQTEAEASPEFRLALDYGRMAISCGGCLSSQQTRFGVNAIGARVGADVPVGTRLRLGVEFAGWSHTALVESGGERATSASLIAMVPLTANQALRARATTGYLRYREIGGTRAFAWIAGAGLEQRLLETRGGRLRLSVFGEGVATLKGRLHEPDSPAGSGFRVRGFRFGLAAIGRL